MPPPEQSHYGGGGRPDGVASSTPMLISIVQGSGGVGARFDTDTALDILNVCFNSHRLLEPVVSRESELILG
eukprot:1869824-Rhodomonas_salina.1